MAVTGLTALFLAATGVHAEQVGIVTVDDLNLRPEPSVRKPPIVQLQKGTEVKIEGHRGDWLKVRHGNQTGYIRNHDNYVHVVEEVEAGRNADDDTGKEQKIRRYRRKVEDLNRQIEETADRVRKFTGREVDILGSLNDLDYDIDRAGRRVKANRRELLELEGKLEENKAAYKALVERIDAGEAYAATRLVALYKLNRNGTIPLLASSGSIYDMMRRKKYLECILGQDDQVRERLLEDKRRVGDILALLSVQQEQKKQLEAEVNAEFEKLKRNREDRKQLLARIRSEKSLQLATLESLKTAAATLDQTVKSLAARPEPAAGVSLNSFYELKGLLKMPISGKIISFFGPEKNAKFNVTVFRSGIDIQAQKGAVIRTVFAGRVLFADWFKGYGNMMIIDHGDSYYTVYAHLADLFKQKGDYVNTGEDIATVGDTAAIDGPLLHFEVRHHGKPLDPMEWIAQG